ncbi:MAG: 2-succinyl-5-enolpyruvyl-6-hydroxy-3-cyclohexene-1-carboxylic-acid synthase [Thalassobius sp.]|nr:2-succinyl-5-enolpyruvyl-6-hydroxy-3-cyclohexene-1-carboxylic-acid synthase [Thalassovita sp.]
MEESRSIQLQSLINIAEICAQHNVMHAVLSPGSRCAPLLIAFSAHPKINCISISDERSAAYIGLGIAQSTQKTVALICTSGTASANYMPAVVEAMYQEIPLLVLTADRPDEWIDQQDGQAIRQPNIYGSFVKKSFHLPVSYEHPDAVWHAERIMNEAILLSQEGQKGPVHVNIPIREPFYPTSQDEITFGKPKIIKASESQAQLSDASVNELVEELKSFNKLGFLIGQDLPNIELYSMLGALQIPVFTDIISNAHQLKNSIQHHDAFLGNKNIKGKMPVPDLLISFGKSILSKQLKLFLRNNPDLVHWHIQQNGQVADVFQSLQRIIRTTPTDFLNKMLPYLREKENKAFFDTWKSISQQTDGFNQAFFERGSFGEFEAVKRLIDAIPENSVLHLANSMSVRYANHIGLKKNITVYSNRGTSGIDGCLSTAVGHSLVDASMHFIITGDLTFFYDGNAFWNKYKKSNVRVLLLNNNGGAIFRMIPGPDRTNALDEFFVTEQTRNASNLAKLHSLDYKQAETREQFLKHLVDFVNPQNKEATILEIKDSQQNVYEKMQAYKNELGKMLPNASGNGL